MKILGISGWFHDSSACLLVDGDIVSYAEEERFSRDKHTEAYPYHAINWTLSNSGLTLDDIDEVVFYLNPWKYFSTGTKTFIANFPKSIGLALKGSATVSPFTRLHKMARLKQELCRRHIAKGNFKVVFVDHYRTHQASAFYASDFEDAAILTMDFAGDGTTETIAHGTGLDINDLIIHKVPNGFALVYAAITHLIGFQWNDEYKVMGMAAYGKPNYLENIRRLYSLDTESGRLKLNLQYFDFQHFGRSRLFSEKIVELLGKPRDPAAELTQREYNMAASVQAAAEEYGVLMAGIARQMTGSSNLCLAGGVAQNCLMNQAICESGLFENVFLQPLAGDVGGSIGGALYRYHQHHRSPRAYKMDHLYLGPAYREESVEQAEKYGLKERPSKDWHTAVAQAIADGLVVGYFDGRMEAGPRALGSRSILADPRRDDMKEILNLRVKHREHFRPFAPSILAEKVDEVFKPLPHCQSLEHMIVTMDVQRKWWKKIPAITHKDHTARVQAVHANHSPNYHKIISAFDEITGVPLVINTSFNDNEPIVCRPEHAIDCFRRTKIDLLVLNGKLYFRDDNSGIVNRETVAL